MSNMLSQQELLYVLALQNTPHLGDTSAKKLLRTFGSAEAIFKAKKSQLLAVEGIGAHRIKDLNEKYLLENAEKELVFISNNNITPRYFLDPSYPDLLKQCLDGPILYFEKGNIDLKGKKTISIVGTRKATHYGTAFCEKLIEELAPLQPVIVSGFAYGIDIVAQKKAMELGLQTIGCLAHGFNQIYPKSHKKYVASIEKNGGFISEFWSNDDFDRNNFLKRNRIIAGLSEATIVIESADKGGSLVTADIAHSYHREVFAVPGRATDIQSQGCNTLIKTQKAQLISSAADVIYLLNWEVNLADKKPLQPQLFVELSTEEQTIFNFLSTKDQEMLDVIALSCNLPTFKVASLLLNMELKGVVKPLPGKLFKIV